MVRTPRNGPETFDLPALEDGLVIDEHALEHEVAAQPELYYHVAQALALAISRKDMGEQALKEIEAAVDIKVRSSLAGEKTTEKAIERILLNSHECQVAKHNVLRLEDQVNKLNALLDSFKQRSYMLKELVSLHLGGYYSDVDSDARQAKEARRRVMRERRV